jgi:hypothetical protein
MAFERVNSVRVHPERIADFQEQVAALAAAAAKKDEAWHWTAHRTIFGEGLAIHFVSRAETFEEIGRRGDVDELWVRALGEKRGAEAFARTNACIQQVQQTLSVQRPDLSYGDAPADPAAHPYAMVTSARALPGRVEECEELIRKVAEAIPKVGDPSQLLAYQVMLGEIGTYWTVRPLADLGALDRQLPAPELLNQAFGHAEGGLIWRSGTEAVAQARRELVHYVPELSNPPQS